MKFRKITIIAALFLVISVSFSLFGLFSEAQSNGEISPAIEVIRSQTELNKCGIFGKAVTFSESDCVYVTGKTVPSIVITSLPENGKLTLNGIEIISGQTIASSNMNNMVFTPDGDKVTSSKFTIKFQTESWENTDVKCIIDFQSSYNTSPVLSGGTIKAYSNAKFEKRLVLYEPDGDSVTYSVKTKPKKGTVTFSNGKVIYTPKNNYSGGDTFSVCATDKYGNQSTEAVFEVIVEDSDIVFSDMSNSSSHSAAIFLSKNNIVTYEAENGEYFFRPDVFVNRIDFLVMLMTSAGVDITNADTDSLQFTDISSVSSGRKKYLAKAVSLGIVETDTKTFRPNDNILKREAAVWISKLMGISSEKPVLSVFSDITESDGEAKYIASAVQSGFMEAADGIFNPNAVISRNDAARILYAIAEIK